MVSRLDTQTNIRLPADLKKSLVDAAAENRRSLSAEIEARLRHTFESPDDADKQIEVNAVLKGMRETIAEIARNDNEREEAVRSLGRDLHMLCRQALPLIDDEMAQRNVLQMLAAVGTALQAADLVDAQAQLRALYYLASTYAKK